MRKQSKKHFNELICIHYNNSIPIRQVFSPFPYSPALNVHKNITLFLCTFYKVRPFQTRLKPAGKGSISYHTPLRQVDQRPKRALQLKIALWQALLHVPHA